MIIKKIIIVFLVLTVSFQTAFVYSENSVDFKETQKILIVYTSKYKVGNSTNILIAHQALLGHFDLKIDTMSINDYKRNDIDGYDYLMVLDVNGRVDNQEIYDDLKNTKKTIFWIGNNLSKIIEECNLNLINKGKIYNYNILTHYLDNFSKEYRVKIEDVPNIVVNNNSVVYTELSNKTVKVPYIFKEKNFIFKLDTESYNEEFFAFADILFDYFKSKYPIDKSATIRIEDIHPMRDPEKLKQIADFLYDRNIPFMIVVIPAYLEQKTLEITTISDKPKIIEALQYMQSHGGRVILHGFKHTFHKRYCSGEGYELWDGYFNRPLDVDIKKYVEKLVNRGVDECVSNGLYPIAFEAPHYAASQDAYKELSKYFNTIVGQIQMNDYNSGSIGFPYEVGSIPQADNVIPENLGYYNLETRNHLESVEKGLNKLSILRSYNAGVFIHPYLSIDALDEMVTLIESKGLKFTDPLRENYYIKTKKVSISYKNLETKVEYDKKDMISQQLAKYIKYMLNIMIIILMITSTFFSVIYFRNLNNRKYFRKKGDKNGYN